MISLASLLIGAGAGFIVGGFTGCGAMAWRHSRLIEHVEAESRRRDERIRSLARTQARYVQNTFGTPDEQTARDTGAEIYTMLDRLETKEVPYGRQQQPQDRP